MYLVGICNYKLGVRGESLFVKGEVWFKTGWRAPSLYEGRLGWVIVASFCQVKPDLPFFTIKKRVLFLPPCGGSGRRPKGGINSSA